MSGECLEIFVHEFHHKPHLGLHKHDLEIKTQRKNNMIVYPRTFDHQNTNKSVAKIHQTHRMEHDYHP